MVAHTSDRYDPDRLAPRDRLDADRADLRDRHDPNRLDLREAYDRGRRDERASRKRHPVLMTFLFLAAAIGAALVVLAAVNGSFGGAGQVMDQNINAAATQAAPVVQDVAKDAGATARDALDGDRTTPPAPAR